jgi:hypothetical protein
MTKLLPKNKSMMIKDNILSSNTILVNTTSSGKFARLTLEKISS